MKIIFAILLILSTSVNAACNNRSLKGLYTASTSGESVTKTSTGAKVIGVVHETATVNFDGSGHGISNVKATSYGIVKTATGVKGTYTVSSSCTAILKPVPASSGITAEIRLNNIGSDGIAKGGDYLAGGTVNGVALSLQGTLTKVLQQ